jgi:16S rRNA processing protein RimM
MSPDTSKFVTVGRVLAPWGNRGKLSIKPTTDFPERFSRHSKIFISGQPMTIESVEHTPKRTIIKLDGINDLNDSEKLRGREIEIKQNQLYPLAKGQYYQFQVIGLKVRTVQGEHLGKITRILPTGSNDNYVVKGAQGEVLIPAIEDVVKEINLKEGYMLIEPIEGLLGLNKRALE